MKKIYILFLALCTVGLEICKANDLDLTEGMLQRGVIVRVWSSQLAGGEGVGHVSLHTRNNYISFWPQDEREVVSGHFNTMEEDYRDEEGRDPEITIFLQDPTPESSGFIDDDFSFLRGLLQQGNLTWVLHGQGQSLKRAFTQEEFDFQCRAERHMGSDSRAFGVYSNWAFNCSSLVFNLLRNRGYLTGDPLSGINGLNTFMAPDQVAQACSLTFLRQTFGANCRDKCEAELRAKGIDGLMSFQERFVGYYMFKTIARRVVLDLDCMNDAAARIKEINDQGLVRQLLEMLSSMGLTEALPDGLFTGGKRK